MNRQHKRIQRKSGKSRRSKVRARNKVAAPRTADQFFARSKQFQDKWTRSTNVVTKMRASKASLQKASRESGIAPQTVRRLVGPTLRKQRNGRYAVRPTDKLLRVLVIPMKKGLREVATTDSRQAHVVSEYWIAVHRYLDPKTGDASALQTFKGKRIVDANGKRVSLLTDLAELDRLGNAGVLSFETIYAKR